MESLSRKTVDGRPHSDLFHVEVHSLPSHRLEKRQSLDKIVDGTFTTLLIPIFTEGHFSFNGKIIILKKR